MSQDVFTWAGKYNINAVALTELLDLLDPTRRSVGIPSDGTSEAAVQSKLRVRASQLGAALWRNNNGACKDDTGRLVRYGLGHDSARISALRSIESFIRPVPVRRRFNWRLRSTDTVRPA